MDTKQFVHLLTVFIVFAITGLSITQISPFILKGILNLEGGFIAGPWEYRFLYILTIPPVYYGLLIVVGTLFGKGQYFRNRIRQTFLGLCYLIRLKKPQTPGKS